MRPAFAAHFGIDSAVHGVFDNPQSDRRAVYCSVGVYCSVASGSLFLAWPTPIPTVVYAERRD
jgi:hypothetical protein